jgi:vacuolar-type H+-ATPase subunit B/Vma2
MKLTRSTAWLLGSLCAIAATACTREEDAYPDFVKVEYSQTQCADRWGQVRNKQELVAAAQIYLGQQGITLHQAKASRKGAAIHCDACTCPTGVVLEGKVQPTDVAAVRALGFYRPQ